MGTYDSSCFCASGPRGTHRHVDVRVAVRPYGERKVEGEGVGRGADGVGGQGVVIGGGQLVVPENEPLLHPVGHREGTARDGQHDGHAAGEEEAGEEGGENVGNA